MTNKLNSEITIIPKPESHYRIKQEFDIIERSVTLTITELTEGTGNIILAREVKPI